MPLAFWSQRIARALVDGLPAASLLPLVGAATAMIVVALAAAFVPARRASRVDPIVALRQE
jgi:putative ABC transport system permease protein